MLRGVELVLRVELIRARWVQRRQQHQQQYYNSCSTPYSTPGRSLLSLAPPPSFGHRCRRPPDPQHGEWLGRGPAFGVRKVGKAVNSRMASERAVGPRMSNLLSLLLIQKFLVLILCMTLKPDEVHIIALQ